MEKSKKVLEQILNKKTGKIINRVMVEELTQTILPFSLHGINPRTIMGEKEWNKIKKQKQKEADHHCMICGSYVSHTPNDWLECHEIYDIDKNKKEFKLKDVICICHKCHSFIHSGRLEMLYLENKITIDEYNDIVEKGNKLLKTFHLKKKDLSYEELYDDRWYLLYNNKKYSNTIK